MTLPVDSCHWPADSFGGLDDVRGLFPVALRTLRHHLRNFAIAPGVLVLPVVSGWSGKMERAAGSRACAKPGYSVRW